MRFRRVEFTKWFWLAFFSALYLRVCGFIFFAFHTNKVLFILFGFSIHLSGCIRMCQIRVKMEESVHNVKYVFFISICVCKICWVFYLTLQFAAVIQRRNKSSCAQCQVNRIFNDNNVASVVYIIVHIKTIERKIEWNKRGNKRPLFKPEFDRSSHFHVKTEYTIMDRQFERIVFRCCDCVYCSTFSHLFISLVKFAACFSYGRFVSGLIDFI